jgi:hypothetical protein
MESFMEQDIEEQPLTPKFRTASISTRKSKRSRSSQKSPLRSSQVPETTDSFHGFNFFGPEEGPHEEPLPSKQEWLNKHYLVAQ